MNIPALLAAIVGVILMSLTVYYGNKVQNKWLRYLSAITGIIISLLIMGYIPSLLGDDSTKTGAQAGNYLGILIVIIVVIKSIFFRKKNSN